MPGPRSTSPGHAVLSDLYERQRLSYTEIARRHGVTKQTVLRWLRAAGISARSTSEATKLGMSKWTPTEEHRAKLRVNVARARQGITAESRAKQSLSMRGKDPSNKGRAWTPEERAAHMAARAKPEYREKLAAAQRGEKGHNWQGGKTPDSSLHGWTWRQRRRECYERDNWTCQDCGCRCLNTSDSKKHPKRKIQAHHIVSRRDGGTDDLSNLITLCMSCHHRRERAGPKE